MMRIAMTLFFTASLTVGLIAQGLQTPTSVLGAPKNDAWEIGLHAGHFFSNGNIKFTPGYGGGIHVRRALDYIFSLRLDLLYATGRGEDDGAVRTYETNWIGGSLQGVISLNNLQWSVAERRNNLYLFGGFGLNSFSADKKGEGGEVSIDHSAATHADIGAGLSFRINERVNFGVEHKTTLVFGDRADLLDGVQTLTSTDDRRVLRDMLNYTNVRLNINIGNMAEQTEPLYWVNPMEEIIANITSLRERPFLDLTDTDGDGVIDLQDQEDNTPAGAPVSASGRALDSDGDGIDDYEDQEPFSVPGYQVDANGVAQVPDDAAELRKYVDERLKNFQPTTGAPTTAPSSSITGLYLPNIYFRSNSAKVSGRDYGTLGSVATVLKSDPGLRLLVIGHTDEGGSEQTNQQLSYARSKNTITELVDKFGIDRNRLVLQYSGETQLLLPGNAEVNRRVEFAIAKGEADMAPPAGD